jgi:hypothetical protein
MLLRSAVRTGADVAAPRPSRGAKNRLTRSGRDRLLGHCVVTPAVVALLFVTAFLLVYNLWNSLHEVNLLNPAGIGR